MLSLGRRPRFDIKRAFTRIARIHDEVHEQGGMLGRILDPETADQYVVLARRALRLPTNADRDIRPLLDDLTDMPIAGETARQLPIRLAGHYGLLRRGTFGPALIPEGEGVWEPLRIAEMRLGAIRPRREDGMIRLYLNMMADRMSGAHAGEVLKVELSHAKTVRFYSRILAYGKREYVPTHPELVGMVFFGLVEFHGEVPGIHRVFCPLNYRRLNRAIHRRRAEPCSRNHAGETPCAGCAHGLDTCDRAVHLRTWQRRQCRLCGNPRALFDPEEPYAEICLLCDPHLVEARDLARRERLLG